MPQVFMTEDEKLVSKLVFMSFLCLWFIVLFTFGLLVYQTSSNQNRVDVLIKENTRITSLWLEKK
jgi:heme/copper-type cytochrome/quinol oxidase subunit 2